MKNSVRVVWATLTIAATMCAAPAHLGAQVPVLQKVFTIGCESCGGTLEFTSISDVAVNARGDLLVADRNAPLLRQFDATGKPVWQGGVAGKGPGEFTDITRLGWLANGAYNIVDGGGRRITSLAKDHAVLNTTVLTAYPTTAATNDAGVVVVGSEFPRRAFVLNRWKSGALEKIELPVPAGKPTPNFSGASVAVASNGTMAIWPDQDRYEILRMDANGTNLPAITRAIERVRYTVTEDSMRRARADREMAKMRAMTGSKTGPPPIPSGPPPLKAHAWGDGLRFDPKGRLWAHTLHGDEKHTVLDVFSPTGAFLGSVKIPGEVRQFALGGTWLATAAENDDGVLQVTLWSVR